MKKILQFLFCLLPLSNFAQNGNAPKWFTPEPNGNTKKYKYYIAHSKSNNNLLEAQNIALNDIKGQIAGNNGVVIDVNKTDFIDAINTNDNGEIKTYEKYSSSGTIKTTMEKPITISYKVVERQDIGNETWLLIREPAGSDPLYTQRKTPIVLRSLIPGYGQIFADKKKRGWFFLITEASLGGLAIASHLGGNYYYDLATKNHTNFSAYKTYTDNYDVMNNTRNFLLIGVGVVYIWNLIDALTIPGIKYYASSQPKMQFSPYVCGRGVGASVTYTLR